MSERQKNKYLIERELCVQVWTCLTRDTSYIIEVELSIRQLGESI